jgi:hypothetical protein
MLTYTSHVRERLRGWGNEVRPQPMLLFLWLVWNRRRALLRPRAEIWQDSVSTRLRRLLYNPKAFMRRKFWDIGRSPDRLLPSASCPSILARRPANINYQGWNTRERSCDKIAPKQINTKGLTHLYYSFVFFHPTTFEIMPMNIADVDLYREFTNLKTNKLQTWVAIGGVSLAQLFGNSSPKPVD